MRIIDGLLYVAIGSILVGTLGMAAGIFALNGSCDESVRTLNFAFWLSLVALLAGGGLAGYTFSVSGSLSTKTRTTWFSLPDERKQIVEAHYACCGFSSVDEKTDGCESQLACGDVFVEDLGNRIKVHIILAAVVAAIQIMAMTCGCCVANKMGKQQGRKEVKDAHKLEKQQHRDEAKLKKLEIQKQKEIQKAIKANKGKK